MTRVSLHYFLFTTTKCTKFVNLNPLWQSQRQSFLHAIKSVSSATNEAVILQIPLFVKSVTQRQVFSASDGSSRNTFPVLLLSLLWCHQPTHLSQLCLHGSLHKAAECTDRAKIKTKSVMINCPLPSSTDHNQQYTH